MTQTSLPPVPLTLEGAALLHQFFHFDWPLWNDLTEGERDPILAEARATLTQLETGAGGQSALFRVLGHKADFLLIHFRRSFDQLSAAEAIVDRLRIREFLEPSTSFVSVIELGLYDSTVKLYRSLAERNLEPHSPPWTAEVEETLARQREAMAGRLFPEVPPTKYVSFYPMDRRRGEVKNWYNLPIEERQQLMAVHGLSGRRYAGIVKQIISGAIGLDDWEWGVDLFADDPLVFKKLIYEMRFDPVSSDYAEFGPFYFGIRMHASELACSL